MVSTLFVAVLVASDRPLVGDWLYTLDLPWTVDPITDRRIGAVVWAVGQLPAVVVLVWSVTALLPALRRRRNLSWTP